MRPQRSMVGRSQALALVSLAPIILALFFCVDVSGQTPEPTPPPIEDDSTKIERVQVDLVTLTLTVTDLYGRLVSGLSKKDFTIYDNKKQQEITFSVIRRPSAGIILRIRLNDRRKDQKSRTALSRFINTSHPSDEYFLIVLTAVPNCS